MTISFGASMRRIFAALTVLPLAVSALAAHGGPDEEHLPEPIELTYHLHGDEATAYVDEDAYAGDTSGMLSMDRDAPTGDFDSQFLKNYAQGPNVKCAGNGLLPVWQGYFGEGTLVGEGTVEFDVVASTGGDIVIEVFADVTGQLCNEDYVAPIGTATVTLPVGEGRVSAKIDLDGVSAETYLTVQVRGADNANAQPMPAPNPGSPVWPAGILPLDPSAQGRLLYGGADYMATFSFTCQPNALADDDTPETPDCMPF